MKNVLQFSFVKNIKQKSSFALSQNSFFAGYMRYFTRVLLFLLMPLGCFSQIGGNSVYSFLNMPASARLAAMGGTFISVKDNDLSLAMQAPSLLNPEMDKSLSFSGVSYIDGIKLGDAVYAFDKEKLGTFMAGIHYANYGQFIETNTYGDLEGTFKAADYCMLVGWARPLNQKFSVGASLKGLYSDYYIYSAFGLALDLSATFYDTTHQVSITMEARNAGVQLKNYVKDNNEALPAEVLFGISKRLRHTPLRFSLTYRHLEKMHLSYDDPNNLGDVDPLTGEAVQKSISGIDNFTRHFIIGAEILLSKNFHIRAAYNFQRRQELKVEARPATAGFSFGVGLKVSKFLISYGRGNYHVGAAANHLSISTNLSEFYRHTDSKN
jgi:hypothetical protein